MLSIGKRSLAPIISHALQAIGVLWLLIQLVSFFYSEAVPMIMGYWYLIPVISTLYGVYRGMPRKFVRSTIEGTDASIEIRIGDLFSQEGALVIPAPRSFDTSIEDGTINERSVQGQYTRKFCHPIESLDRQIGESLMGSEFSCRDKEDKPYGSRRHYKAGTVALVQFGEQRAYFVAIATLNKYRRAKVTRDELLDALPVLWENIRTRGDMDPINVPVVGSGYSRSNATREELIREIVKSFVAATYSGRLCELLRIMISPSDFGRGQIDLEELGRFLEHECRYGRMSQVPSETKVGTAA